MSIITGLTWDICSWGKNNLGGVWVTRLHQQGWENSEEPDGFSCSRSWLGMGKVPC